MTFDIVAAAAEPSTPKVSVPPGRGAPALRQRQ